ncbi:MAG: hypothetical protein ABI597_09165, partial [Gammaproteobacteria bacterium]
LCSIKKPSVALHRRTPHLIKFLLTEYIAILAKKILFPEMRLLEKVQFDRFHLLLSLGESHEEKNYSY